MSKQMISCMPGSGRPLPLPTPPHRRPDAASEKYKNGAGYETIRQRDRHHTELNEGSKKEKRASFSKGDGLLRLPGKTPLPSPPTLTGCFARGRSPELNTTVWEIHQIHHSTSSLPIWEGRGDRSKKKNRVSFRLFFESLYFFISNFVSYTLNNQV